MYMHSSGAMLGIAISSPSRLKTFLDSMFFRRARCLFSCCFSAMAIDLIADAISSKPSSSALSANSGYIWVCSWFSPASRCFLWERRKGTGVYHTNFYIELGPDRKGWFEVLSPGRKASEMRPDLILDRYIYRDYSLDRNRGHLGVCHRL
jgi:hypothetical protein